MASFSTLDVRGHLEQPVPNTLVLPEGAIDQLAILLPGGAYSCDAPLLFYPQELMVQRGIETFRVEYSLGFGGQLDEKKLFTDVRAAVGAVLDRRSYERVSVIGKSLGTLAMTHLFEREPRLAGAGAVWLTPLLLDGRLHPHVASGERPSVVAIGTRDPHYDAAHIDRLRATGQKVLVFEGADHSLGVEGDLPRTLAILRETVEAIGEFLDRKPAPPP